MKSVKNCGKMPLSIGINLRVTGHCNQGGRKYMEDFFSVAYQQSGDDKDLEYAFFGIYDGHGGSEAATFAKENLMNGIVSQKLFWSDSDQDILRAIREGYIATHYAMWREQEKWPKTSSGLPSTAGTTASVAFIRRGKIYIGHVGDSGIVLGYQEEADKYWRARPLTHDHKPECNVEKARITNSGGKVITKSGVPRVVWNRPKIGHKGPVRRSTPIDEIPFLAVARSLGDLWSYNSALNEFVVSPDPDVKVIKIDAKTFRCLIFGTDGLWNVVSASEAVDHAYEAELANEWIALGSSTSEWKNPSKVLVDKALEQWSIRKMRADNTSVVTIFLDPPGPLKKNIMRNCTPVSYGLEYAHSSVYNALQPEFVSRLPSSLGINESVRENEVNYEPNHLRNSGIDQMGDTYSANGSTVMTRYDYTCDSDGSDVGLSSNSSLSPPDVNSTVNSSLCGAHYSSFAESYNSLLISSFEKNEEKNEEEEECYDTMESNMVSETETDNSQYSNQYQLHQYQQQCMAAGEGYSLTKLETCGEQQFNSVHSVSRKDNVSFQDFGEDTMYNQYSSVSSSYPHPLIPSDSVTVEISEAKDAYIKESSCSVFKEKKDYCERSSIIDNDRGKCGTQQSDRCDLDIDESIQINEISSSIIETSNQNITQILDGRQLNNSTEEEFKLKNPNIRIESTPGIEQNENQVIVEPRRLRSSILINVDYSKRTLRSRNALRKDLKAKVHIKKAQQKRSIIAKVLNTSNTSSLSTPTLSSTNHRSLVWSQRQHRKSTRTFLSSVTVQNAMLNGRHSETIPSSSVRVKPKSKLSKHMPTSSSKVSTATKNYSNSVQTQSSASKRSPSSRNSAWCYPAVQTRNRVQKRNRN